MNAVTMREIKERFRRRRAVVFLSIWVVVLVGLGYLTYVAARAWAGSIGLFGGISPLIISSSIGRIMFELVSLLLMSAILLVVPGVAALSIVGERERLTLPLLQVSQLTPRQIVFGKLGSSLVYQLLLLISVAPIMLIPMLFGGVRFTDVLVAVAVIVITAIVIGSLSVWVSARAKSTRGAVAGSYLWTFGLAAMTALVLIGEVYLFAPSQFDTWGPNGRELYSAWGNPYIALVSAVDEPITQSNEFMVLSTPFDLVDELLSRRQFGRQGANFGEVFFEPGMIIEGAFGRLVEPMPAGVAGREPTRGPLWVRSLALAAVITILSLWGASRQISVPRRAGWLARRRSRPKEAANAAA